MKCKKWLIISILLCSILLTIETINVEATYDELPSNLKSHGLVSREELEGYEYVKRIKPIRVNSSGFGKDHVFDQFVVFGSMDYDKPGVSNTLENMNKIMEDDITASRIGQYGNFHPDSDAYSSKFNTKYGIGFPHIVSFLNENANPNQTPDKSLMVTSAFNNKTGGISNHGDGSGIFFPIYEGRSPHKDARQIGFNIARPSDGRHPSHNPTKNFKWLHTQMTKDQMNAYIFGEYRFDMKGTYSNLYQQTFPIVVKISNLSEYGDIEYEYRLKNSSFIDVFALGVYTYEADVDGMYFNSKMKTQGNNKGVYFEAQGRNNGYNTKYKLFPPNLVDVSGKSHKYQTQWNTYNYDYEKVLTIDTVDLSTWSSDDISKMYGRDYDRFAWFGLYYDSGPIDKEDQTRGEVIRRRDEDGNLTNKEFVIPAFNLKTSPVSLPSKGIGSFKFYTSVSNLVPINYPEMIFSKVPIEDSKNQIKKEHMVLEQSLDGEIESSSRQPGYLEMSFTLDDKLLSESITEEKINFYLADQNGSNKEPLPKIWNDKPLYKFETNGQIHKLIVYNDYTTENGGSINGQSGFLWQNRKDKKIIIEMDVEINESNPSLGRYYQHLREPRGFETEVRLESKWNENIRPKREISLTKNEKVNFLFESNIYNAQVEDAGSLVFGKLDQVPAEHMIKPLKRNFEWEKPYKYKYTDPTGKIEVPLNMSVGNNKKAYVTIESTSLNKAVTKPIPVTYSVTNNVSNIRANISYIDEDNKEKIDIPIEYPRFISEPVGKNFSFVVPAQFESISNNNYYQFSRATFSNGDPLNVQHSDSTNSISGKMRNNRSEVLSIYYIKKEGSLSDGISAEAVSQRFKIGENLYGDNIDPKSWVKNVTIGSKEAEQSDYDVSIKEGSYLPDVVGVKKKNESTVMAVIKSKDGKSNPVELPIPYEMIYGNSIAFGGDEVLINGKPRLGGGSFSYHPSPIKGKSYIMANSGAVVSEDNNIIHSGVNKKDYLGIELYRPTSSNIFDMMDKKSVISTYSASSNDPKSNFLDSFGENRKLSVEVGDVIKAWSLDSNRLYLTTEDKKETLGKDWNLSINQYFELTNEGYKRLYGNLAIVNEVSVPYDITEDELKEHVKDYLDLTEVKKESKSVEVIGFKETSNALPSFEKPGEKDTGIIVVSETLTNGNKISYDYVVSFVATDERIWQTETIKHMGKNFEGVPDINRLGKEVITNIDSKNFNNTKPERAKHEINKLRKGTKLYPEIKKYAKDFNGYEKLNVVSDIGKDKPQSEVYLYVPSKSTVTLVEKNTVVPDEDFELIYYHTPTRQIELPTEPLTFGRRQISKFAQEYPLKQSKNDKENRIVVTNTYDVDDRIDDWGLYVSSKGLYNKSNDRLISDLVLKNNKFDNPIIITDENTPIYTQDKMYKTETILVDNKKDEGLFLKVPRHNQLGEYSGIINYKYEVAP